MLLAPADKPFDYRHPPRLALGLALLLLLIGWWLPPQDNARQAELDAYYTEHLEAIEWPLYPSYLLQHQRGSTARALEQAASMRDHITLARAMGYDRGFVDSLAQSGSNYLDPEVLSRWLTARQEYDAQRNRLSSQVLGLDGQRLRPITFLSHAFVDSHFSSVLVSVLLLLLIGLTLEWSLGSGALLAGWAAGSLLGGLVYLLAHQGSVIPLTGSGNAIAGVLGVAFLQFRKANSLRVMDSVLTFSSLFVPALMLAVAAWQCHLHQYDLSWLLSTTMAFGGGMAVWLVWSRWFSPTQAEPEIVVADPGQSNEEYRKDLQQVLQKVAGMQFATAEKHCRALLEQYPQDKRLLEQLYHLAKLKPQNLEFEEIAFHLLTLPNQPASNQVSLRIYRDYSKRSVTFVALDDNTCLQLVMRFARCGALKEGEELFKRAVDSNRQAPLVAKAAQALSQAFAQRQQEQRAGYYANFTKT